MQLAAISTSRDLGELERVIENGRQTFMEVGLALARIRDARLHLGTHETFEAYCKERWGWGANYARKLMSASSIAVTLRDSGTMVPITSERQARELAKAGGPSEQADAWQEAVTRSGGEAPTAAIVREVVEDRKAPVSHGGVEQRAAGEPEPDHGASAREADAPRHRPSNAALLSSESNEWYTPERYVDAARRVMGGIDLDPASCEEANAWIQAKRFFTALDNGLTKEWSGRVWLNCPYGRDDENRSNQAAWSTKLLLEHSLGRVKQAHLLVNSATGNRWFRPLWAFPICFVDHRIKFRPPMGHGGHQPTHSNVVVYLGIHRERFVKAWGEIGHIVMPGEVCSVGLGGAA